MVAERSGGGLRFREGDAGDLRATFELRPADERAVDPRPDWASAKPFIQFMAAQPDGAYWLCERDGELAGYARVVRLGRIEEVTELEVSPAYHGLGIARGLLERCWPGDPTAEIGRIAVAGGSAASLALFTSYGAMPVAGRWRLRQHTDTYVERRAQELEDVESATVSVLEHGRAVEAWNRLEPLALGHERPGLHDFLGRDRSCLALIDPQSGEPCGLCWVSASGEVGPAVGAEPQHLVPVVLAALDRIANTQRPEHLVLHLTTIAWWVLRRLRGLGFLVEASSWIMCTEPIPGLDRYVPSRSPMLL